MRLFFIIFIINISFSQSCIKDINTRDFSRNDFTHPEQIESEHFVIHFTISDADSQFVNNQWMNLQSNFNYAQSIIDLTEYAFQIYISDGWEEPPPDCDESISDINSLDHCINYGGNSLYDIYISNDGVGMVVPETPYIVEPYTGGYTSYMKISSMLNEYESLPVWAHHVVAHELHHSIQMRYGYSVSGSVGNYMYNGWLFEQTATYMENVIFPNSNHLQTMLSNCNVVTPLTYPEYGINYPAEIYPYRSALWQKFLVESYGDSTIVRDIWEGYGLDYASGIPVSLFPIYNEAVINTTNGEKELPNAYKDYALWRYFTGDHSLPNSYFNESGAYCTASTHTYNDSLFSLITETGSALFIDFPDDVSNLIISTDNPNELQFSYLDIDNSSVNIYDLVLNEESSYFNFDENDNMQHVLIVTSNYLGETSATSLFSIQINQAELGDVNFDGSINVLDAVLIINFILYIDHPTNEQFLVADINNDTSLDILDIVLLINLIID